MVAHRRRRLHRRFGACSWAPFCSHFIFACCVTGGVFGLGLVTETAVKRGGCEHYAAPPRRFVKRAALFTLGMMSQLSDLSTARSLFDQVRQGSGHSRSLFDQVRHGSRHSQPSL